MLLSDKTMAEFGYSRDSLTQHSKKLLWLACDYCGAEYTNLHCNRNKSNAMLDKDACKACKAIKIGDINFIKLGVRNVFELKSTKDKLTQTNLDRYGVERPAQSKEIADKAKNTMMERYGTTAPLLIDGMKERVKQTCLEKYGVENPSSAEECKQKRRATCKEKFGKETYLGSEVCKQKVVEKLGVDNPFKLQEYQDKALEGRKISGNIKLHEGLMVEEWAKKIGFSRSHFNDLVNEFGWETAVKFTKSTTDIEMVVKCILDKHSVPYEFDKSYKQYRPDFMVGNLIIECDGLFYHSDAANNDDDYHVKKREFYVSEGFTPLFFRENEILEKRHIVESVILNKLGKSTRLFARKLKIGTVSKKEGAKFLEDNHLMGQGRGECIGLRNGAELVSLMRLCRVKGNDWEISRFCNKVGCSVVGGLSKILFYFTEAFKPEGLISFVDLRYGTGDYMESLGFVRSKAFKSFKWTDGKSLFNRMKFPSNTGYDRGLYKLWDCGQLKFTKVY